MAGPTHGPDHPDDLLRRVTPRAPEPEVFDREVVPGNQVLEQHSTAPDGATLLLLHNAQVTPFHEFHQYPFNLIYLEPSGSPRWLGGTDSLDGVLRFWLPDQRLEWSAFELLTELPYAGPEYQGFVDWLRRVAALESPGLAGHIGRLVRTVAEAGREAESIWRGGVTQEMLATGATAGASRRPRQRGGARLHIDRESLRRALSANPVILEALEPGMKKASGRPGVNVASVWQLARRALYSSADVPVLGTRECLQNSYDAHKAAVAARQLRSDEGRFEVEWDEETRRMVWSDNGIGMDADTILTKFLVLGNTGKGGASNSDEAAGGFGVAKAVILGTASKFRWELHSRDNLAVSTGPDSDVEIFEASSYLRGTRITIFDVSPEYDYWWDSAGGGRQPIEERIKELLSANDLPGLRLFYNGEEVHPRFSRRGGSNIKVEGSWGQGTMARVKAYKRPDRRGAYWVRLNGLYQFKSGSSGDLGVDVVIDLTTVVRPGDQGYPLNAGRDALQGEARYTFRALIEIIERENASVGDKQDDEVFDPELETDSELDGDVQDLTRTLLEDPELAKVLEAAGLKVDRPEAKLDPDALVTTPEGGRARESSGGSVPTHGPAAGGAQTHPASPDAEAADSSTVGHAAGETRGGSGRDSGEPEEEPAPTRTVLKTDLPDEFVLNLSGYSGRLPWFPAGLQTVQAIRKALDRAERESAYEIHPQALEALEAAAKGSLTVGQLRVIATEMDRAARMVAQLRGLERPHVEVAERKQRQKNGNPFGHLGALRVSRVNYPREKARALKRSPRRFVPLLLLWDTTLKLVAHAGDILRSIKPGFVLEDGVIGLAQRRQNTSVTIIYIHPDRLMETVERNRERPLSIAAFLHGVACHELTHADGRMGDGHSEAFVSAREDLGTRTAFLLPQLATVAARLLKLPEPKDDAAVKLGRLERQLQKAKEGRDSARADKAKALRQIERELAACRREMEARAAELSAHTRANCTGACGCHAAPMGIPDTVRVPPSPHQAETAGANDEAERVLELVRTGLLQNLPTGVSPAYAEAFLSRYRGILLQRLGSALEQRNRPTGEGEVLEPLPRKRLTPTPFSHPQPGEIVNPLDAGQVRHGLQIGAPARLKRDFLDTTWNVRFPKGTEGIVTDIGEQGWLKGMATLELDTPVRVPDPEALRDRIDTIYVPARHLENW